MIENVKSVRTKRLAQFILIKKSKIPNPMIYSSCIFFIEYRAFRVSVIVLLNSIVSCLLSYRHLAKRYCHWQNLSTFKEMNKLILSRITVLRDVAPKL